MHYSVSFHRLCLPAFSSRCLWQQGMMYLSLALLCLTLPSSKRSAVEHIQNLSSPLEADIIHLHLLCLSFSTLASSRAQSSASSSSPSSLMQSMPATRLRSLPSWRWGECWNENCTVEMWMPIVNVFKHVRTHEHTLVCIRAHPAGVCLIRSNLNLQHSLIEGCNTSQTAAVKMSFSPKVWCDIIFLINSHIPRKVSFRMN